MTTTRKRSATGSATPLAPTRANILRDRIYRALHQGTAHQYAGRLP
jgi:hypothetical protein